eukprot:CAMPEP_0172640132 /NCGR_PEP_ID=MMETSP1068-20121228/221673_1 /TAXON_ID=35684 /ORGANISM="Pseudopedinella elastica, Strain CCMP716" /LENGTH=141 /DNA_ID=CAMNT_0013453441 /DNA_START=343 /DNA_END=769 /DNA_ORIENTATION=+
MAHISAARELLAIAALAPQHFELSAQKLDCPSLLFDYALQFGDRALVGTFVPVVPGVIEAAQEGLPPGIHDVHQQRLRGHRDEEKIGHLHWGPEKYPIEPRGVKVLRSLFHYPGRAQAFKGARDGKIRREKGRLKKKRVEE